MASLPARSQGVEGAAAAAATQKVSLHLWFVEGHGFSSAMTALVSLATYSAECSEQFASCEKGVPVSPRSSPSWSQASQLVNAKGSARAIQPVPPFPACSIHPYFSNSPLFCKKDKAIQRLQYGTRRELQRIQIPQCLCPLCHRDPHSRARGPPCL